MQRFPHGYVAFLISRKQSFQLNRLGLKKRPRLVESKRLMRVVPLAFCKGLNYRSGWVDLSPSDLLSRVRIRILAGYGDWVAMSQRKSKQPR